MVKITSMELIFMLLLLIVGFLIYIIHLLRKNEVTVEEQNIENAILKVWKESGLSDKVGELATYAREIRETHKSIEEMLRVPNKKGIFGEMTLEAILSDQLPPELFGIRKEIIGGKKPDAYIKSSVGLICIDSKFPLENYRKMIECDNPKEKENFKKRFIQDVRKQLDEIGKKYVCPEKGTAEFAFAYIPSESVYWFLITENEALEMLREYAKKGVQVVSPLTLSQKIELIKTGIYAKKLSEDAEKVKNDILRLSSQFKKVDELWQTCYNTHLKNLRSKAEELDVNYKKLREEFDDILKCYRNNQK